MFSKLSSPAPDASGAREVLHGVEVDDPYRWLEDQDSSLTRAFLRSEQHTYREYLEHHRSLRSRIERRVRELLSVETVDLPVPDHKGGLIYLKREAHQEQKAIYHHEAGRAERLLLSVEMLGRDAFTSLSIIQISADGHFLAFGIRTGGEDAQEIGFYDLKRRQLFPDRIPRGLFRGLVFDRGGRGFFYVHEEMEGEYLVRRAVRGHKFGTSANEDYEVFHAGDGPEMRLTLQTSEDESALGYIIVSLKSISKTRFLVHPFPLNGPPREIADLKDASIGIRFSSLTLEAVTTYGAPHGRVVRISPEHPEPDAWIEVIPETDEELYGWEHWEDARVLHYRANSRYRTRVCSESGDLIRTIDYPTAGTTILGHVDPSNHRLFYSHSDVTEAPVIYSADLISGTHALWRQRPDSISENMVQTERSMYRSKDGVAIPMTLIHPQNFRAQGPVILSAYGGSGVSATPKFSALVTVLLEEGFTFAIAHVRGGGERGLDWHLAAHKQRKQTSVDDLIAGAEWLIEQRLTTSEQLGIVGQSAGGLLVLAALMQRPDLFRAALALGPLADLTRFHLFGVGRSFVGELGSPDDPNEFEALYRLSPYHHIRPEAVYPAVLVVSGDRDKRCDALHARKMIARLRPVESPGRSILLDYAAMRGHKPVLPLSERIRALTDRLTFLIAELRGASADGEYS